MCRQFDSSQHHRNPLIISGFFVSDTVSDTVLDTLADKQHYTQIAFLRCRGRVFGVTSLHYLSGLLELWGIELLRDGTVSETVSVLAGWFPFT